MNLHTPERLSGESFADYKARRVASKAAMRQSTGHHLNGGTSSRTTYRNSLRSSGSMGRRTRAYVALLAAWAAKRITKSTLSDDNGAYTLVGATYDVEGMAPDTAREHVTSSWVHGEEMGYTARRKWLAGISSQRGF